MSSRCAEHGSGPQRASAAAVLSLPAPAAVLTEATDAAQDRADLTGVHIFLSHSLSASLSSVILLCASLKERSPWVNRDVAAEVYSCYHSCRI